METTAENDRLMALIHDAQARKRVARPEPKPTWRRIVGSSPGDEFDRVAALLGEEWRRGEDCAEDKRAI